MDDFDDMLTTYNRLKPPEDFEEFDYFENQNYFDKFKKLNLNYQNLNSYEFENFNYPDLTNPFSEIVDYTSTSDIIKYNHTKTKSNEELLRLDIEDLLRQEGITQVNGKPLKFGSKELRTSGNPNSWHRKKDAHTGNASARDISIVGGTDSDYEDFKNILLSNNTIQEWMKLKKWGIINEITPAILKKTKGTGKHFHFGKDQYALDTWNAWNDSPSCSVLTDFQHYNKNKSKPNFNSNSDFAKMLLAVYQKELSKRGIDPDFAYMLVAQDAQETLWGKKPVGTYNYGNITTSKGKGTYSSVVNLTFKNYNSVEEYVKDKIDKLSNSRYNFFNTFTPNSNIAVAMQTLANKGYDSSNKSYGKQIQETYKTLMKYLS